MDRVLVTALSVVLTLCLMYLIVSCLWGIVCFSFGLTWSWETPLGIWAALELVGIFLRPRKGK